jgi:hypothetical protein
LSIADPFQFLPQAANIVMTVSNYIKMQHYKEQAKKLKEEKEKDMISNIDKSIDEYDDVSYKDIFNNPNKQVANDTPDLFYYKTGEMQYNYDMYYAYSEVINQKVSFN